IGDRRRGKDVASDLGAPTMNRIKLCQFKCLGRRGAASLLLLFSLLSLNCQGTSSPAPQPIPPKKEAAPPLDSSSEARESVVAIQAPPALSPQTIAAPAPPQEPQEHPQKTYRVAALGDSITDFRSGGGGYLKAIAQECPESRFDNYGKGGDMVNQMLRRWRRDIRPAVAREKYTTLLVYGGVNDLYSNLSAHRTNARIEKDLATIYQEAEEAGLEVYAMTVSPWGGFKKWYTKERGRNTQLLNSWILGRLKPGQVKRVLDTYPLLSCGQDEFLCPRYENRFHDGLHPGPAGHALLGSAAHKKLFFDCL
ncbi:MAG: GDSL-type esterase/lipase family protein, partial [Polyangiaceae bacterium]|nr:GDSL-type esterase/lipase family protein [Polyangiaceae bacterium]